MIPDTRKRRHAWGRATLGALLCVWLAEGCGPEGDEPPLRWSSHPEPLVVPPVFAPVPDSILRALPQPHFEIGNLARRGDALWLPEVVVTATGPEIRLLRLGPKTPIGEATPLARFNGASPGIVVLRNGDLLLVHLEGQTQGRTRVVARRGSSSGTTWSEPIEVMSSDEPLQCGPPVTLGDAWIGVPILWWKEKQRAEVAVFATYDAGATWASRETLDVHQGKTPRLAATADGRLVLAVSTLGSITRTTSGDSGATWTSFQRLHFDALPLGFGLHAGSGPSEVALSWTDPAPDTTVALPGLQSLRFMSSQDAGENWGPIHSLALWPGRVPTSPSIWLDRDYLVAAFTDVPAPASPGRGERVVCLGWDRERLALAQSRNVPGRYGVDPRHARAALRTLAAHTLARPPGYRRLFVEGYFMRTLVAAYAVHESLPGETPEWFDVRDAFDTALVWGNTLVATQDTVGYWPLGYGAIYVADMAAALRIFPALEPFVDETQRAGFERAARRFVSGLERDGMILPSGAYGVGWWGSTYRNERRSNREPYLVSTALAGVALHAWLHHRSGDPKDRDRMRQALEYTLSQLQPDGAFARGPEVQGTHREGRLVTAAYVQEGWMAADALLPNDPEILPRLRAALPAHVDWVLKNQQPDGRWHEVEGEFARTPAIVDFLIWYDQRCEVRPEVREAIGRAARLFADIERRDELELYIHGNHHEVQRAIAGRTIAALGSERFVP